MISQGTDGLSRGDMLEAVLTGREMLSYVPLHRSVLEQEPSLREWVEALVDQTTYSKPEFLNPSDWFVRGHGIVGFRENLDGVTMPSYAKGTFIWSPPPAAARLVIEELRQVRHKRQASLYFFIVPRLMSPEWRSQLFKSGPPTLGKDKSRTTTCCNLLLTGHHGNSKVRSSWVEWRGNCVNCLRRTQAPDDIFCQNYSKYRPGSIVCSFNSCTRCYQDDGFLCFPVNKPMNE